MLNINSDNPFFYPYSIQVNKCSASCHNINDPYAKLCVPDVVKNINNKVFNLVSRTNERHKMSQNLHVNVDQMQMFVTINNTGIMISAGENVKN